MNESSNGSEGGTPFRGVKRVADDSLPGGPRKIVALAEDVVNKIAAGEIIVAPVHALKELIENSVDAGSTAIEVLVKDGGLKLLQITDNGHGIHREDLGILCERFTTSKLKTFDDLNSIGTYGFRGEALASISHIAHLSVTTRTKESSCAWRAQYSSGKLAPAKPGQTAEPKPIAGRPGTQITVEDLFYNVPTRRRAFRSSSEEFAKILDLVGRYAVHCHGVSFSCKKHGESSTAVSVPAKATTMDRIRQIHGAGVARELIELSVADERLGFKAEAIVSNANYSMKRTTLLLFINHRSVDSSAIKKAIEQLYTTFLPKGGHPFIYLNLHIEPQRVDVNVHPTKREVNFLSEDEIIEELCGQIRKRLGTVDSSRTFATQTLITGMGGISTPIKVIERPNETPQTGKSTPGISRRLSDRSSTIKKRPYENSLVRTDARERKITSMLLGNSSKSASSKEVSDPTDLEYEITDKEPTICRLSSLKDLRAEVREAMHNELTDVFATHTFVGIVDMHRRIAALQGGVKLYLIDYGMLCNEYFYQVGLTDFGNFGAIKFEPPLNLNELLEVAARYEAEASEGDGDDAFDWDEVVQEVSKQLVGMREMLEEYFSLQISEDGELLSIPLLMKGYMPSLAKLPQFLLRLGPHVNWENEKDCFQSFLSELAAFYVPEALQDLRALGREGDEAGADAMAVDESTPDEDEESARRRKHLAHAIEYIMFPAFKNRLVATGGLLSGVVEVANLKGLYRVFERC